MARSRNIKPGFFTNDELAECSPYARLLFAGLWTIADKEGRLDDRPKKIKALVLPFDNVDCDELLQQLHQHNFITRYLVDGGAYLQINNWKKHQNPHCKESASEIPEQVMQPIETKEAPDEYSASTVQAPEQNNLNPADSLMVMCGKPGTGKNHLALAIAQYVIRTHESSALFTTALRIARAFKSTWSKTADRTESEVIKIYTDPDLLIIDEVGVQFGSDTEKQILFEIINTRYEKMRPTILISNQTRDELSAFIGERVIDRMNDGGGCTLAFTWDSYRSRAA
ncbi:transposase/IS protein [Yersinia frederiksenii]|nr:transposase/IS protein [Yersinia frederiksenii]